jgi:biotin-dependent carboxylase-like uncharacterized protein
MKASFHVLNPGLMTTIQDLGRSGFHNLGIGTSGALDPVALRLANLLVGNEPGTGGLEALYLGPALEVDAESVRISFVGAATIEIRKHRAASSGRRIDPMRSVLARRGEVVRIGSVTAGAALYIGVEGGFDIEPILGSVSTNIRGGIGGWQARALISGERLPLLQGRASDRAEAHAGNIVLEAPRRIRVIPGPQADHFNNAELTKFFANEYTVQAGSDRVGMRLQGEPIRHARGFNIASDATAPGSIQVPGTGQPIVLMADRQTIGGYPKIATVISADLPALGRLSIGRKIGFEAVTVETALALRRQMLSELENLPGHIVPLVPDHGDIDGLMLGQNLISGVVDAFHDQEAGA